MLRLCLMLLLLCCVRPLAAAAADLSCAQAAQQAERRHHTPPGLLGVVAKVESGRPSAGGLVAWPWTIDVDGQGQFFDSKAAAIAAVRQAQAAGAHYIDVGCMQVDLRLHPHAFASLEEAFDPVANADYAARLLLELHRDAGGNWFLAVGRYHSPDPALAGIYREAVADVAVGRAPPAAWAPLYLRTLRRGAVRLAAGGHVTVIHTTRQPAARWHRKPSVCRIAAVLGSYLRARPAGCGRRG